MRSDPETQRALLQEHHLYARGEHLEQFGASEARALTLLLQSKQPMGEVERSAFAALARQLDPDPLQASFAPAPMHATTEDREAVARLAEIYRQRQRQRVAALAERYGSGPRLRRHGEDLAAAGLLDIHTWNG